MGVGPGRPESPSGLGESGLVHNGARKVVPVAKAATPKSKGSKTAQPKRDQPPHWDTWTAHPRGNATTLEAAMQVEAVMARVPRQVSAKAQPEADGRIASKVVA